MKLEMNWTVWAVLGLILLVLEVVTPGFFMLLFFGLAALAVALLTWLVPDLPDWLQLVLFAGLALVALVSIRSRLRRAFTGKRSAPADGLADDFLGQAAVVREPVGPGQRGKVEFHGALWAAESEEELPVGAGVRIAGREGLTFKIVRG